LGDLGIDEKIILKYILEKYSMKELPRFNYLRIGSSGGLFKTVMKLGVS
jgi:hypothetical protein